MRCLCPSRQEIGRNYLPQFCDYGLWAGVTGHHARFHEFGFRGLEAVKLAQQL